jgi:hypothetical protein
MLSLTSLLELNFRWPTMAPGELLALTLLMVFAVLSTLELRAPREKLPTKHLRQSYKTNIGLFIVNSIAMSLVYDLSSALIRFARLSVRRDGAVQLPDTVAAVCAEHPHEYHLAIYHFDFR